MARPGAHGADLTELANYLLINGPRKVHPAQRRVRVIHNQTTIVDTTLAVHVWEHDAHPQFYFPLGEVKNCSTRDLNLIRSDGVARAAIVTLTFPSRPGIGEQRCNRVLRFTDDRSLGALANLVRLEFGAMDQWLEEDVPIYVHPKDPFKRIDTLHSSRPIEVRIGGHTVAKSSYFVLLLETGLPPRYYLPPAAIDPSVLRKSDRVTRCPYKGDAQYYDIVLRHRVWTNIVWYYRFPTHESAAVAGLLCFLNEEVDILLDGKTQRKLGPSPLFPLR